MNKKELYLHNIAAKYILGESIDLELEGSHAEMTAFFSLLKTSKQLKEALDTNASLKEVDKLLTKKKMLTKKFENLSNINWCL